MLTADQFVQVQELLAAAERWTRRLKRLRAGHENRYGWRYCRCGETNQLIADRAAPYCAGCDRMLANETDPETYHPAVEHHLAGWHKGDPSPHCIACIVPDLLGG